MKQELKNKFESGEIILIYKPIEWTSFQVVNKIRWIIKSKLGLKKIKVGHAGTLDPLANGLLIVCTGKMTKLIDSIQVLQKEYTGVITLGATTPSFDLETNFDQIYDYTHVTKKLIQLKKKKFIGFINQYPPIYSAIKKNGKRLYQYAREGETVEFSSRKVEIKKFDLIKISLPEIHFRILCSKGTYIRSIAHDFGKELNSGAYLSQLSRTKIGVYDIADALSIEEFEKIL
jgi:tRNA pseudouridine55 synthase|tara:strand:- start:34 stop:726 length:693 start_codon:yes stop_codon:yes gene_type:complete